MKHPMRTAAAMVAAALVSGGIAAAPAQAEIVYQNNFDTENGGNTVETYTGFNGLTVNYGSMGITKSGDGGVMCAGGTGACVDLSGNMNAPAAQLVSGYYAFGAGETVTLDYLLAGNQRIPGNWNSVGTAFNLGTVSGAGTLTGTWGWTVDGVVTDKGRIEASTLDYVNTYVPAFPAAGANLFSSVSFYFTPDAAGSVRFSISSNANNGIGPTLDNLSLSIARQVSGAVPEPATWGMMILGFGAIGGTMRRRRPAAKRAIA